MSLALGSPDPGVAPPPPGLTSRRKAAMLVQYLLSEGQGLPLASLPEEVQLDLTRELGAVRMVDRVTLTAVAEEFLGQLDGLGLASPGGLDHAVAALSQHLSPAAAAKMRSELARSHGIDPWSRVSTLPVDDLVRLMEEESTEVAAVALSKLRVDRAAELLTRLPGDRARRITYAMSRTETVQPAAVLRIGHALAAEYAAKPERAFESPSAQRVGAILNSARTETREAMLTALEQEDEGFADGVRRALFTFADIPVRVAALDMATVVRGLDGDLLVTALAAARAVGRNEGAAADYMLDNISQRLADSLRDEMSLKSGIKRSAAEASWAEVVAAIKMRAEAGEITLVVPKADGGGEEDETLD